MCEGVYVLDSMILFSYLLTLLHIPGVPLNKKLIVQCCRAREWIFFLSCMYSSLH